MKYHLKERFTIILLLLLWNYSNAQISPFISHKEYNKVKVIGTMLGDIKPNGVTFWVGLSSYQSAHKPLTDYSVSIFNDKNQLIEKENFSTPNLISPSGRPIYNRAWVCNTINELEPNTTYKYKIHIAGSKFIEYTKSGSFTTAPEIGEKKTTKILVSSCMGATKYRKGLGGSDNSDTKQKVWDLINKEIGKIDLNLFLGDTHYANDWRRWVKWYHTMHQFKIKGFEKLVSNTPTYAIYDDHDFIDNNVTGCSDRGIEKKEKEYNRTMREKASLNFHELWVIPKPDRYKDKTKGIFHKLSYGNIDIYMLDTRYFREPPNYKSEVSKYGRSLSLLGSTGKVLVKRKGKFKQSKYDIGTIQWEWLENEFDKYDEDERENKIKLICFSSTFTKNSAEKLTQYGDELERLKKMLSGHSNVHFLSGDIHTLDYVTHDKFGKKPPVKEITSSGIGRIPKGKQKRNGFVILEVYPKSHQDDSILEQINVKFYEVKKAGSKESIDNYMTKTIPISNDE